MLIYAQHQIHFVCFSARFTRQNEAISTGNCGGSVVITIRAAIVARHEEDTLEMAAVFEE